ncbi:MAG: hypothetical protein C5B50_21455 [Verrucomicrobia bacterium]|nr:MAG: hypothetical protein C5B50_21455 [Verrucomicrobiota bacterium]
MQCFCGGFALMAVADEGEHEMRDKGKDKVLWRGEIGFGLFLHTFGCGIAQPSTYRVIFKSKCIWRF